MDKLPKPFFVLAPMDDVTDIVFRQIIADCARPDLFITEFVNVDGLQSPGRKKLLHKLRYLPNEKPILAQLWGTKPENFYKTVKELVDGTLAEEANHLRNLQNNGVFNYAGVDLNMGCPVKTVIKNGACAALMNNRNLAGEIIAATKEAAHSGVAQPTQLDAAQGENAERNESYTEYGEMSTVNSQRSTAPESPGRVAGSASKQDRTVRELREFSVSVKTRIGFTTVDWNWIEFILGQKLNMLSIHGRTAKQASKVPANWDLIGQICEKRDVLCPSTKIVGNGDVMTRQQGLDLAKKYNLDGIMIARGALSDPFVFAKNSPWANWSKEQKIELYKKHVQLFAQTWKNGEPCLPAGRRKVETLNKFCKIYVNGFDGAKEMREKLMRAKNAEQLLIMLQQAVR